MSIKIKKSDVGRYCRVEFDDIGATDGIVMQVDSHNDFRFFDFNSRIITHNNGAPCISIGRYVSAKNSGL